MAQSLADIEAVNERLVRDFFAAASSVDFDKPDPTYLHDYLSDGFIYQYGDLRIEGLETYIAQQTPQLALVASASAEITRLAVIGDTVLHERFDVAILKSGQQHRWQVSSVILISDGKIAEWRDYPLPGAAP